MSWSSAVVFGGSGFLGSYVARALIDRGVEVLVADLRHPGGVPEFVLGDEGWSSRLVSVTDPQAVADVMNEVKPRWVVHAAAIVDPQVIRHDPLRAIEVNQMGAVNVFEAARATNPDRIVFVSSIGVHPRPLTDPVGPDHPIVTRTQGPASGFYGAAKGAAELFAMAYVEAFGLDIRIVRPSALYGLGMARDQYVKAALEGAIVGETVHYETGGPARRDYTYVCDIADLIATVLEADDIEDRLFLGGTGRELIDAQTVVGTIRDLIPGAEVSIGAELSERDQREQRHRARLDMTNAREQLGWNPPMGDIRAGLVDYADRFRRYLEWKEAKANEA